MVIGVGNPASSRKSFQTIATQTDFGIIKTMKINVIKD